MLLLLLPQLPSRQPQLLVDVPQLRICSAQQPFQRDDFFACQHAIVLARTQGGLIINIARDHAQICCFHSTVIITAGGRDTGFRGATDTCFIDR